MPTHRHRRTQAERTAATREKLLDAALDVVAQRGYANASTTAIARAAGVSRGAQLHHFPSKAELVVAAIEHAFARQEAEFRARFDELPPKDRTRASAIDLLWELFQGSSHSAIRELLNAARTDRILRPVAAELLETSERTIASVFVEIFPDVSDEHLAAIAARVATAILQTAALDQQLRRTDVADEMVEVLKVLAEVALPPASADADIHPIHQEDASA